LKGRGRQKKIYRFIKASLLGLPVGQAVAREVYGMCLEIGGEQLTRESSKIAIAAIVLGGVALLAIELYKKLT
jgi:hypothetical protein